MAQESGNSSPSTRQCRSRNTPGLAGSRVTAGARRPRIFLCCSSPGALGERRRRDIWAHPWAHRWAGLR